MPSGLYAITSPSGGKYIGSAVNIAARWRQHRHQLKNGTHYNNGLKRAYAKYGLHRLVFQVLIECRIQDLLFFEQRAIDSMKPRYNACPIAGSQLGRRHTAESNEKNAAAHRGRKQTIEQRSIRSRRMMGNQFMVGRRLSAEHRAKLSLTSSRPRRMFTAEEKAEIIATYRNEGLLVLCARFQASHKTIRKVLLAEGVTIRPRGPGVVRTLG